MSDKELADFLSTKFADLQGQYAFTEDSPPTATQLSALKHTWYVAWMQWLQQPAENPVKWSKPGPCPVTPEQFDAIYNDEEEPT
jgi:methionine synthase II (cobalamin-independent)